MRTSSQFKRGALILAGLLLASVAQSAAWAQTTLTPAQRQEARVDARQERQTQRIQAGVTNGSLTAAEQARLNQEQARIEELEQRIEQDGRVSRREAVVMERAQDRASHHIARAKHDRQRALR